MIRIASSAVEFLLRCYFGVKVYIAIHNLYVQGHLSGCTESFYLLGNDNSSQIVNASDNAGSYCCLLLLHCPFVYYNMDRRCTET